MVQNKKPSDALFLMAGRVVFKLLVNFITVVDETLIEFK